MKWTLLKHVACTAMMLCLAFSVRAAQITGDITLSGAYTINGGNLGIATAFNGFTGVRVADATGSFTGTDGDIVRTMRGFGFKPANLPTSTTWSLTAGLTKFDFELTSLTIGLEGKTLLELSGTGIVQGTGFTDTAATWTFTANNGRGELTIDPPPLDPGQNAVPDGGATVLLLGIALSGLGLIRRKLA